MGVLYVKKTGGGRSSNQKTVLNCFSNFARFQYIAHASTPHGNEIRLPQIRKNRHNNWRPGS